MGKIVFFRDFTKLCWLTLQKAVGCCLQVLPTELSTGRVDNSLIAGLKCCQVRKRGIVNDFFNVFGE